MEGNKEELISPKSPKTPKLSEEVCELNLNNQEEIANESENENNFKDKLISNEESETLEFPEDSAISNVIKQLIANSPAGQVQKAATLCAELFPNYSEFIGKEAQSKMKRDGYISDGKLVTEAEEGELENSFEIELKEKLENYVKELFPETGAFSICKVNENEWKVHIVGERLKAKAFWSGHWHSTWLIQFIPFDNSSELSEDNEFKIEGEIDLIVHYHEEGSVQLSANKQIPSRVNFKSKNLSQSVEKIYFKIKDSEDAVQLALNEAYQQLAEKMFKKLRRQLPVTRTKMDWGKFVNYNLSSELKK